MSTASFNIDSISEGFPTPFLPKQLGKPNYYTIKELRQLLTVNAASVERSLGGGQNGYLGIVLPYDQYSLIAVTPFFLSTKPGRTATVTSCTSPR